MKENTKSVVCFGAKYCVYCGAKQKTYEDRSGCDYRESGSFYSVCDCDGAKEEIKYKEDILNYKKEADSFYSEMNNKINNIPKVNEEELIRSLKIKKLEKELALLKAKKIRE